MVSRAEAVTVGVVAVTAAVMVQAAGAVALGRKAACPTVARPHRNLVLISARTGRVDRSFPDANLPPLHTVTDGHGGWFVGGDVTCIGRVPVAGIAHLRPSGRLDRSWHARLPRLESGGGVGSLIRAGDTLYSSSSSYVAAFDVRTGARRWLITNLKGGWGLGLAANRQFVVVGGYGGTRFKGVPRRAPVALEARTGKVLAWHADLPRKSVAASPVLDRGRLFLTAADGAVAIDVRTGRLTDWPAPPADTDSGGPSFITHGLVVFPNRPILSERTGQPVQALAHIGGAAFAAVGETLYVAGDCANGSSFAGVRRDGIGAVDLATARVTSWAPRGFPRDSALGFPCFQAIAADRERVLVSVL